MVDLGQKKVNVSSPFFMLFRGLHALKSIKKHHLGKPKWCFFILKLNYYLAAAYRFSTSFQLITLKKALI